MSTQHHKFDNGVRKVNTRKYYCASANYKWKNSKDYKCKNKKSLNMDICDDYVIDYEALAAHIVALDKMAKDKGIGIWRVIFDPQLQPKLLATKYGDYIKSNITLSKKRSWVRHDEHYHVDFEVKCK